MKYTVTNIDYDTDDKDGLPKSLVIEVSDDLDMYDAEQYISDEISNQTGFCHKGFTTTPDINAVIAAKNKKNIIEKNLDYTYNDIERILGDKCEITELGDNAIGENFIVAKHNEIDETSSFLLTGATSNDYIYTCVYTDYQS